MKQELWVSLPHAILFNMSHSLQILEIMYGYIIFVCMISFDARLDTRLGRMWWPQDRRALHQTSPTVHLVDDLLVMIETYVCECWWYLCLLNLLMLVILNVVRYLVILMFMKLFDVVIFVRYMVLMIHVLILWYMWCQWYISFILDGIIKTNKKGFLVTLPSVTLDKEVLCRVPWP